MHRGVGPGTDMDTLCDLLNAHRRRLLIEELQEFDVIAGPDSEIKVGLGELAKAVSAAESGLDHKEVSTDRYRSVKNSLRQTHLPMLDDHGLVDYDDRAQTVTVTDRTQQFALLMAAIESSMERAGFDGIRAGEQAW